MDARNFREDLAGSKATDTQELIIETLSKIYPDAKVEFASEADDRNGADVWVSLSQLIGIDVKVRKEDCKRYGKDDIVLELESSRGNVGWAISPKPSTTQVLWIWRDTRRYYICSAFELACVLRIKRKEWIEKYSQRPSRTVGRFGVYATTCVYPPRQVLDDALTAWRSGSLLKSYQ